MLLGTALKRLGALVPGVCLLLTASIFTFIGTYHQLRANRCTSTTAGVLDSKYYEETHSNGLGLGSSDYEVSYSFDVGGRQYSGDDRIHNRPTQRNVTVYFNPTDPDDNLLEPQPLAPWFLLLTIGLGVAGIILVGYQLLAWKKRAT